MKYYLHNKFDEPRLLSLSYSISDNCLLVTCKQHCLQTVSPDKSHVNIINNDLMCLNQHTHHIYVLLECMAGNALLLFASRQVVYKHLTNTSLIRG